MYEKDGEKYFVMDSICTSGMRAPPNWVKGQEEYAKGWIECFHAYQGLGPPETHWTIEKFMKYSEEDFVKDVFEEGYVDVGVFQSTYLKEWYTDGFNTAERNARMQAKFPDRLIVNGRWDPREGEAGLKQLEEDAKRYNLKGVKLYTAEWYNGSRGWTLKDDRVQALPREVRGAGHHEHPRPQGPDDLAAGQGRVRRLRRRPRGDRPPEAQLHRRARRAAADRGLLLHGDAGAQRLRRPGRRHRRPDARPPALLREGHGRAAVLGRRGQDAVRLRLRHLGAEVAGRGLRRLGLPRRRRVLGLPAAGRRGQEEDPRPQRAPSSTASRSRRTCGCPWTTRSPRRATTRSWSRAPREHPRRRPRRAGHGLRPGARRADHRPAVRLRRSPCPTAGTSTCGCGCPRRSARRTSRTSWPPTRDRPCAACRGARGRRDARGPLHGSTRSTPPSGAAARSPTRSPARRRATSARCASCSGARRSSPARRGSARRCSRAARRRPSCRRCASPTCPTSADARRCRRAAHGARHRRGRGRAARSSPATARRSPRRTSATGCGSRGSCGRAWRPTAASAARCWPCATARTRRRRSRHESRPPARVPPGTEARGGRRSRRSTARST